MFWPTFDCQNLMIIFSFMKTLWNKEMDCTSLHRHFWQLFSYNEMAWSMVNWWVHNLFGESFDLQLELHNLYFEHPDLYLELHKLNWEHRDLHLELHNLNQENPDLYLKLHNLYWEHPDLYLERHLYQTDRFELQSLLINFLFEFLVLEIKYTFMNWRWR